MYQTMVRRGVLATIILIGIGTKGLIRAMVQQCPYLGKETL